MSRNYKLEGIEPKEVWKHFYDLSQIPRESGNSGPITDFLLEFCREQGLEAHRDEAYNVIAKVPATPGYEKSSSVILHSHTDMVCIKDEGVVHDFTKDPIICYQEGDEIRAEGTTLGADDGIGVAFMMAAMADKTHPHPALECVFTADEETDMNGGVNLDYTQFKSKYYLNLDGFGFSVGSAGEIDYRILLDREKEKAKVKEGSKAILIKVGGLNGGHSGNQALLERASAIVLLNRILLNLGYTSDFQILDIKGGRAGGQMATSIAASAQALIAVPAEKFEIAKDDVEKFADSLKEEYKVREPNLDITVNDDRITQYAISEEDKERLLDLLSLLPEGLRSTHQSWENTLGSCSNIGVLEVRDDVIEVAITIRSTDQKRYYFLEQAKRLAKRLGARTEMICDLPEWPYTIGDEWMAMIEKLYPEYKPYFLGGTGEIGFFTKYIPGLNAVSLTPNQFNCHSTNEYLSIKECQYFYYKMWELLEQMKEL